MEEKFRAEIEEFDNAFSGMKDKRIVLYGIGRYTSTLLANISGYNFVGLMDREKEKIGQTIFGVPVIDMETAEKTADMVVINVQHSYWSLIAQRIADMKLPVYFRNGERVSKKEAVRRENPFREYSLKGLRDAVKKADVVSFDFFDTLFMRAVCAPRDVSALVESEISPIWSCDAPYMQVRDMAKQRLCANYTFDELYAAIEDISGLPHETIERIRRTELETEKRLLTPRNDVFGVFRELAENSDDRGAKNKAGDSGVRGNSDNKDAADGANSKDVYIVSDMYLPKSFYTEVLSQYGIHMDADHILVSCELRKSKAEGSLWEYFVEMTERNFAEKRLRAEKANSSEGQDSAESGCHGARAVRRLHVGDNESADIEIPARYGIDTYLAPNPWKMLENSSMQPIAAQVCGSFDSAVMGCELVSMFSDAYAMSGTDGTLTIDSERRFGYQIFAPIILAFFLWLTESARRDGVKKLVFMSRDGYFLLPDYELMCEAMSEAGVWKKHEMETCYIKISRQIVRMASIETREDLSEYMAQAFMGSEAERFLSRLDIRIEEREGFTTEQYIDEYIDEIRDRIREVKERYRQYLNDFGLDNDCALVDLCYYGSTQHYLNKFLGTDLRCYYFNANVSDMNPYTRVNKMYACFQKESDKTAKESGLYQKIIYLESHLTAPHGMISYIDENGAFVCHESMKNQELFYRKEEIDKGVREFISDYVRRFGKCRLKPDCLFSDTYYAVSMDSGFKVSDEVKSSFWFDNALASNKQSPMY